MFWKVLGKDIHTCRSPRSLVKLAKLNWKVKQDFICTYRSKKVVPGYVVNIRKDTKQVLGVVTKSYKVLQNEEVLFLLFNLYKKDLFKWEYAGEFTNGKKIWVLGKYPYNFDDTSYIFRVIFMSGHDGETGIKMYVMPMFGDDSFVNFDIDNEKRIIFMHHTENSLKNKDKLEKNFNVLVSYMKAFSKKMKRFDSMYCTDVKKEKLIKEIFPIEGVNKIEAQKNEKNLSLFLEQFQDDSWTYTDVIKNIGYVSVNGFSLRDSNNAYDTKFRKLIEKNKLVNDAVSILIK